MNNLPDSLNLPNYLPIVFGLAAIYTLFQFYRVVKQSPTHGDKANLIIGGILLWIGLQAILSLNQFYSSNTMTTPPRFLLTFFPTFIAMLYAFFTKNGRSFVDSLPLLPITWLNIVRIPVEFCLYWLFLGMAIPELMTFTGRNFDILAGLTAPIIAYFGFQRQAINNKVILAWNYFSLGLLLFIIANGLLSAPTVLQQFAFEQPNIALAYFPYVLLPSLIVPVVLFGHFVSIRQLSK